MRPTLMLIVDFILFFILPLICWELCREVVGDYPTMILSTLPGIFYSLYRFKNNARLNFTGICVILNLTVGLLVDLLSGSALQLLWNNVIYSSVLLFIYSISLVAKKPLYLYFTLDLITMRGYDRKITKELFFEKKIYKFFQMITLLYCANELIYIVCLSRWILKYGVEAYRLDIVLDNSLNIILSGASLAAFILIHQNVNEITPVKNISIGKTSRKLQSISSHLTYFHFERVFLYFSSHK